MVRYLELSSVQTCCFQNLPFSSNSLGGKIVFKISSLSLMCDDDDEGLDVALSDTEVGLTDNVDPAVSSARTGSLYFTRENEVLFDDSSIVQNLSVN